jgi:CHAD domain-containing protein
LNLKNKLKEYPRINKKTYLLKYKKILESFSEKLQDYIKNPNDKNIHDVRVGIRRLETAYRVLPRKIRMNEEVVNYLKQTKILFKLMATIRDIDIICKKFESKYQDKTRDLVSTLKNTRIEKLHNANELSLKILNLHIPQISKSILKKSKLNKRYLKVLDEIELDIHKNTIISLGDEKKIEELHMLRKDFKKLRYSLELISYKEKVIQVLENLKKIQDVLGEIHDSDIIINHLRSKEQSSNILEIIETEIQERRRKYEMFVSIFNKRKLKARN